MIGGGVTPEGTEHPALPAAHHRRGPVAERRPRHDWLWTEFGAKQGQGAQGRRKAEGAKPRVNIIGPIYGTFNMPSDLAEIRRLVEGIGAEINLVFPLGQPSRRTCPSWPTPTSMSACTASSAACSARRWSKPYLQAPIGLHSPPPSSCASWASSLGLDPEPFIEREKHTTIKPLWDLWRSRHPGLLRARPPSRSSPTRPTRAACATSSRRRWACPAPSPSPRKAGVKTDNAEVREAVRRASRRWSCSAATTSACTLAESRRAAAIYIPASFPGRHHPPRTPARRSWATPARPTSCRKSATRCSTRCSTSCRSAPSSTGSRRRRRGCTQELPWDDEAQALLDELVEAEPFLIRISAAKRLRDPRRARRARSRRGAGDRRARGTRRRGHAGGQGGMSAVTTLRPTHRGRCRRTGPMATQARPTSRRSRPRRGEWRVPADLRRQLPDLPVSRRSAARARAAAQLPASRQPASRSSARPCGGATASLRLHRVILGIRAERIAAANVATIPAARDRRGNGREATTGRY